MVALTGSKLPLARRCRWWLRGDVTFPELQRSQAADDGVRLHALHADLVDTGTHAPCSPSDEMVMRHLREYWGTRRSRSAAAEVSFGLDAARGQARNVGSRLERKYPDKITPGEIFLSTDYVWHDRGSMLVGVGDLKTGFGAHVDPPEDNLQLLAGAAALFLEAQSALSTNGGKPPEGAQIEILHAREDGVHPRTYIASPLVLYRAMSEIALIQAGIDGSRAVAGEHCRFCPALGACPETGQMLSPFAKGQVQWTTDFVSDANDALIIEELSAVKKMIDAIESAVKERAQKKGGIALSDGKVYRAVVCEKSVLDKELVEKILGPRYAECTKIISYEQFRRVKA